MGKDSNIEWTDNTGNIWEGCTKVHDGCRNCYAETRDKRYNGKSENLHWGQNKPRRAVISFWNKIAGWQANAAHEGVYVKVFISSLGDIFEESKDLEKPLDGMTTTGELRDKFLKQINQGFYPNLIFLLLTKRPSNILSMVPQAWIDKHPPANVWFGTSISDQKTADKYTTQLLVATYKMGTRNAFLSVEPQIGPVSIAQTLDAMAVTPFSDENTGVDFARYSAGAISWVIQGGESGPNRRPFNLEWAREMKSSCKILDIPYFFKQIDKVRDKKEGIPVDLQVREFPDFEDRILKAELGQ